MSLKNYNWNLAGKLQLTYNIRRIDTVKNGTVSEKIAEDEKI